MKLYCPVCKEETEHQHAFFDVVFCAKCKVLRVPNRVIERGSAS